MVSCIIDTLFYQEMIILTNNAVSVVVILNDNNLQKYV